MATQMYLEAKSTPKFIAAQFAHNLPIWQALKQRLAKQPPEFVVTVARGSSDHAAMFAKYLIEIELNQVVASMGPSVYTLYGKSPRLSKALVLALSQSGQSPDICAVLSNARQQGAITVALVNDVASPLAAEAEFVLPLGVGEEKAVAATKTYLAMLAALLQGVMVLKEDPRYATLAHDLPALLEEACQLNWDPVIELLLPAGDTLTIGRGLGYPIAQEAALKLKETSGIHAESFSGAEVQHGPLALLKAHYPIIIFTQQDAAFYSLVQLSTQMRERGAYPLLTIPQDKLSQYQSACHCALPLPVHSYGLIDPLLNIQAFYLVVEKLARARGFNPDAPEHLQKVTRTL